MKNIINIFFAPTKVFQDLKEKPVWLVPLVIILVVGVLIAVLTVVSTRDIAATQQEEALRARGMTEEQMAQARTFMKGPGPAIFGGIGALIVMTGILLLFSLIVNVLIPPLGGTGNFKKVFCVITHAGLVRVPGDIIRFILMLVTKSIYATTSLAAFAPGLAKTGALYRLLSQLDIFVLWEMILIAMGISITNDLKKNNAYYLVFGIWLFTVLLSVLLGGLFSPRVSVQ